MSSRLFKPDAIQLSEFQDICSRVADASAYPLASAIAKNVPVYNVTDLEAKGLAADTIGQLQDEWHAILHTGPGVFVIQKMYHPERYGSVLSATNEAFDRIIARERQQSNGAKGDHFAASGKNDRIWNSFSKHALEDPKSFFQYYSNPWLAAVSAAWLGPNYRVTAQVNAVRPGGAAQQAHRDFHLGFMEADVCSRYPAGMQLASQFLTLQGAVAHSDMPLDSGPTRLLPFSQTYPPGYLAWRLPEFREYFQKHYVALELQLGDGVFFNPALFHAAGANEMDPAAGGFRRVANLLQISSALGKPMETIDSLPLVDRTWDLLVEKHRAAGERLADPSSGTEKFSSAACEANAFIQAVADGYPFPTNLDRRPPAPSGMAPESEQDVLIRGLGLGWDRAQVIAALEKMRQDSRA